MQKKTILKKKKETCISFIEKTRSEFCTIAKKKISLTNRVIKEKVVSTVKIKPQIKNSVAVHTIIKPKTNVDIKNSDPFNNLNQLKKSPRELAIIVQTELKKLKVKYIK